MIEVNKISKTYQGKIIVNEVSFALLQNSATAILGRNGSGKSTLIKIILGLVSKDKGEIYLNKQLISPNSLALKQLIGYLPENSLLYSELTPLEFLKFTLEVRCIDRSLHKDLLGNVSQRCGLTEFIFKKIGQLSKGQKRRVAIAQCLIHDPKILILDEPTDGLDPIQKEDVQKLILDLKKNRVILIATHQLAEAKRLCDSSVVLNRGSLVFSQKTEDLQNEATLMELMG